MDKEYITHGDLIKLGRKGASSKDTKFRKDEQEFRWKELRDMAKRYTGKESSNATVKSIARREQKNEKIAKAKKVAKKMANKLSPEQQRLINKFQFGGWR